MDLFESTFGIIRSLINACDYYRLVNHLSEQVDHLFALDAQRCKDIVCPYIEQSLHQKAFRSSVCCAADLDATGWKHLTPSLFEFKFNWPEDELLATRWFEQGIIVPYAMNLTNNDAPTLSLMVQQPWCVQIGALTFNETITLEHIGALSMAFDLPVLRKLSMKCIVHLDALQRLVQLPSMSSVESIHIILETHQQWSTAHVDCLNQLPKLQDISVSNDHHQPNHFVPSVAHPNLANFEHIDFDGLEYAPVWFSQPMPKLRTLSCRCTSKMTGQFKSMLDTIEPKQLISLALARNHLEPQDLVCLPSSLSTALKVLFMPHNALDEACTKQFVDSGLLNTLTTLNVRQCVLNEDSSALIFEHLSGDYFQLDLSSNQVTGKALYQLGVNMNLRSITSLALGSNPLGDEALAPLRDAVWLHTMHGLHVRGCQLRSEDAAMFLLSPELKALDHISLGDNHLDNDFIRILTNGLPSWQSLWLDLDANTMNADGLLMLMNWPGLEQVSSLNLCQNDMNLTMDVLEQVGQSPYLTHTHILLNTTDATLVDEVRDAQVLPSNVKLRLC